MSFDIVVVGAGPAGMTAAAAAAKGGAHVCLVHDCAEPGGQIWKGGDDTPDPRFTALRKSLHTLGVVAHWSATVVACPAPNVLRIESSTGCEDLQYGKLILATGARERFLPFPGWTLQGVLGIGGLQSLVKSGLPIAGKRVVLAGSGPLMLAVAATLARKGARVLGIFEQASAVDVFRFGAHLLQFPAKIRDAIAYRMATRHTSFETGAWVVQAHGDQSLQSVTIFVKGALRTFNCDYLGCGFHLVPNLELPRLLQCRITSGYVEVDVTQQSSSRDVYCAGELTGIGGLEKAICEGEIAGLVCSGRSGEHLYQKRDRLARFASRIDSAFALRPELKTLAAPDTLVCRCEDVQLRELQSMYSWREAKLHTRCGMGPCQGRICGAASEFLFGWNAEHARPPLFPARVSTIAFPVDMPLDEAPKAPVSSDSMR